MDYIAIIKPSNSLKINSRNRLYRNEAGTFFIGESIMQKNTAVTATLAAVLALSAGLNLYQYNVSGSGSGKTDERSGTSGIPKSPTAPVSKKTPSRILEYKEIFFKGAKSTASQVELEFYTDAPIRADSVRCRIEPEIPFQRKIGKRTLSFSGNFDPGKRYLFHVERGLKNDRGYEMKEPSVISVTIPLPTPEVRFLTSGRYLPYHAEKIEIPISSTGMKEAELVLEKAYENNLNPYRDSSWMQNNAMIEVFRKKIRLASVPNRPINQMIDLKQLHPDIRPGIYRLSLDGENILELNLTDLAVQTVHNPRARQIGVTVRSIASGKPVQNASVRVLSAKNQTAAFGKTGMDGSVLLPYRAGFDPDKDRIVSMIVKKSGDLCFFEMNSSSSMEYSTRVSGKPETERALVFTERGICRPGEEFTISAFIRECGADGRLRPLKNAPVDLLVNDPLGREFHAKRLRTDRSGFLTATVKIPENAQSGRYRIQCLGTEKKELGETSIRIGAFVPDRIKVDLKKSKATARASEPVKYELDANYYFGTPLEEGSWQFRVETVLLPAPPAHWGKEWTVGDPSEFSRPAPFSAKGRKGREKISVTVPGVNARKGSSRYPLLLAGIAEVQEPGGRGVSAIAYTTVFPSDWFIGLRTTKNETGARNLFWTLLPAQKEGTVLKDDAEISFRIFKEERNWNLVRKNGRYEREWTVEYKELPNLGFRKRIPAGTIPGSTLFRHGLTLPGHGRYRILAESGDRIRTKMDFWHYEWEGDGGSVQPLVLVFKTDSDLYRPGATASVSVESPAAGEMFLTFGERKIDGMSARAVRPGKNRFSVRIPENITGSSYFAGCTLVTKNKGDYDRRFGVLELKVDQTEHRLNVETDLPDVAKPAGVHPFTVRLSDGKGMPKSGMVYLYAVEEGALSVTGYKTPDPFQYFFGPSGCPFRFHDLYGAVFPSLKILPDGRIGGDAEAASMKFGMLKQKEIARLALPPIQVPESGVAHSSVRLPDHTGALRFMLLASGDDAAGSTEKTMILRNTVSLTISAPEVLTPGDEAELRISIFNHGENSGNYALSVHLPEALAGKQIHFTGTDLKKGSSKTCAVPVKALEKFGSFPLSATLKAGNGSRTESVILNVRPFGIARSTAQNVWLNPGECMTVSANADAFIGPVKRRVRISASPAIHVRPALDWLNGYPYGCLEQTVAGAFPYLSVSALEKAGLLEPGTAGTTAGKLQAGYRGILPMLLSDGSFAMWDGGKTTWKEGTLFAHHFIFESAAKGYLTLAGGMRERLISWLKTVVSDASEKNRNHRAYAIYILALAGDPSFLLPCKDILADKRSDYADFLAGCALIRGGYAASGAEAVRNALAKGCWTEPEVPCSYSSDACRLGMTLHLIGECGLETEKTATELTFRLAGMIRSDRNAWGTTQANAWASLGLTAFAGKYPPIALDGSVRNQSNGKTANLSGKSVWIDAGSDSLEIRNSSKGKIMVQHITSGYLKKQPVTGGRIVLKREYLDRNGKKIQAIPHGERITVRLTVCMPTDVENLVLADLLPSGLEIEDEALATRSRNFSEENRNDRDQPLRVRRIEKRGDRFLLFGDSRKGSSVFSYQARAVTRGKFMIPPLHMEGMYHPDMNGVFMPGGIFEIQ